MFTDLADQPGAQIHKLFAGLYLETLANWLDLLSKEENPEYAYLVIGRFFELYRGCVLDHMGGAGDDVPKHWRAYHKLANRLTIKSPIFSHLRLISLGARAHIRYDLGVAFFEAEKDYRHLKLGEVSFDKEAPVITGPLSAGAFTGAALNYVQMHRAEQSGWRLMVLIVYEMCLRLFLRIWLGVIQSWRRSALSEAQSRIA